MTKYREILRLTALGLSLRNIQRSLHVSQRTIMKVQHRPKSCLCPGRWMNLLLMLSWNGRCSQRIHRQNQPNGCRIMITSGRNCSAMASTGSFSGRNTLRNAVRMATMPSCIPSSAITSSRMSRSAAPPCISRENRGSRSR